MRLGKDTLFEVRTAYLKHSNCTKIRMVYMAQWFKTWEPTAEKQEENLYTDTYSKSQNHFKRSTSFLYKLRDSKKTISHIQLLRAFGWPQERQTWKNMTRNLGLSLFPSYTEYVKVYGGPKNIKTSGHQKPSREVETSWQQYNESRMIEAENAWNDSSPRCKDGIDWMVGEGSFCCFAIHFIANPL